jgi:hypothetical protein
MGKPILLRIIKASMLFFMGFQALPAQNTVYSDEIFPYRIVCKNAWVQQVKNDSVLILKNSAAGKKTQFQLQKYVIDTGYDAQNKTWSRLRYMINQELAARIGRVIWVDSTEAIRLGNYHAFELFAFYSDLSGGQTTWWAEYSRWTDHDGSGYLASVIGDTVDMRQNFQIYKALMDSVDISQLAATRSVRGVKGIKCFVQRYPVSRATWYDLLGRDGRTAGPRPNAILVKKNMKQIRTQ